MREEFLKYISPYMRQRITPAHAGRIILIVIIQERRWDHPRACGKNLLTKSPKLHRGGSPPRMREELKNASLSAGKLGITPAHAGRISYALATRDFYQDHPRACGKNVMRSVVFTHHLGSPPRMREEFEIIVAMTATLGITPAHAGRIL